MIDRVGEDCCGCAACAQICPNHCIKMKANDEGFLYPFIQTEACINCGVCEKTCPILGERIAVTADRRQAWAAVNQDRQVLMASSSGGLFAALSNEIFKKGGCVFGAAFTADFRTVRHVMAESPADLHALQGSKYMQSEMGNCYLTVKEQLCRNRWVLFTGTPCQAASLRNYLGREYDKLLVVDLICHGTPSALLWRHYLEHMEDKLAGKITAVSFRDKAEGWKNFGMDITTGAKGKYHCSMKSDPYMQMFLKNFCLRESCYQCKVKSRGFFSDITMGDLWGADRMLPDLDCTMGVSLSLIHTEKGRLFFDEVKNGMRVTSVDYDKSVSYNPSLFTSVARPRERDFFYSDLQILKWSKMVNRYAKDKLITVLKKKIFFRVVRKYQRVIRGKRS